MADETYILKFEVESGDAISEQERLKAAIINLKQEASNLQKAYKAGSITLQEYAAESTRVENNQKKLVSAYSNVQRSVTGLKNPIKELTESNKALTEQSAKATEQFKQLGEKMELGGVSVTGLSSKLTQFATPVGAAIGLVTALGAAYAQSTVGAKDLEFAESELAASFQLVSDKFASLTGSGKEGEGFFTQLLESTEKIASNVIKYQTVGLVNLDKQVDKVHQIAKNVEELQEKERLLNRLRADGTRRLTDNQDLLTEINDSQTTWQKKQENFATIQGNIRQNLSEQKAVLIDQLALLESQTVATKDKEHQEELILDKKNEIADLDKSTNRLLQQNLRLQSNMTDQAQKELKAKQDEAQLTKEHAQFQDEDDADKRFEKNKAQVQTNLDLNQKHTQVTKEDSQAIRDNARAQIEKGEADKSVNFGLVTQNGLTEEQITNLLVLSSSLNLLTNSFKKNTIAYKATATAKATIDTYLGADQALSNPALVFPLNTIAAAIIVAAGLANVAKINGANFASGGFVSGPGTGTSDSIPANLSNGEYVVKQKSVNALGVPFLDSINNFADGGIVTNSQTSKLAPQFSMEEMLKKMPQPILGFKEFTEFQQRLDFKESITKA